MNRLTATGVVATVTIGAGAAGYIGGEVVDHGLIGDGATRLTYDQADLVDAEAALGDASADRSAFIEFVGVPCFDRVVEYADDGRFERYKHDEAVNDLLQDPSNACGAAITDVRIAYVDALPLIKKYNEAVKDYEKAVAEVRASEANIERDANEDMWPYGVGTLAFLGFLISGAVVLGIRAEQEDEEPAEVVPVS